MPPFADLLQELVRADDGAGAFRDGLTDRQARTSGGGRFQEAADFRLGFDQLFNALPERGVVAAGCIQIRRPVLGVLGPGLVENGFDVRWLDGHAALRERLALQVTMREMPRARLTRRRICSWRSERLDGPVAPGTRAFPSTSSSCSCRRNSLIT
jgi:hypothetical protein